MEWPRISWAIKLNKSKSRLSIYDSVRRMSFDFRKIKFFITGIINTIVGYVIFALLVYFNVPIKYALLIATTISVIFNYFSYKEIVFKQKRSFKGFLRHIFFYCIIYFLNITALTFVIKYLISNHYLAQLVCMPTLVFLSWIIMSKWIFK